MDAANGETHPECVRFALEGEALCRVGDFANGVKAFIKALEFDTKDVTVLSAIYLQLGNAYFYLEDYDLALEYHKRDIQIARETHDEKGEAKASGNIATTLKCLGQFEEALVAGQRQLDIYRKLGDDKNAIGRALYNLGNIYLAKAKSDISSSSFDGDIITDVTQGDLILAAAYYKENYDIVKETQDLAAQGRVCGNLGSVEYLLGNFPQAVMYHQERLLLARQCRDVPAERRAYTNLGNCHVFLGQYPVAEQYYLKALALVDANRDRALEAQACYSLGNIYSLMEKHNEAIQYYKRHLEIARELSDTIGQSRAFWSLGSAYAASGNSAEAVKCAEEHLRISEELNDPVGQSFAQASIQEYAKSSENGIPPEEIAARIRRISMEQMDIIRMTPDRNAHKSSLAPLPEETKKAPSPIPSTSRAASMSNVGPISPVDETEDFFDLLSRVQSHRYEDQRAVFVDRNKENDRAASPAMPRNGNGVVHSGNGNGAVHSGNGHCRTGMGPGQPRTFEELMDMIAGVQSKRIDEQRADLPHNAPSVGNGHVSNGSMEDGREGDSFPDDQFFEMLAKAQESRMTDQRAVLSSVRLNHNVRGPTVPEEDFSALVMARRIANSSGPSTSKLNPKN